MFSSYQEAFDATMLKLEAQGAISFSESQGICQYTDQFGNQCAFGIHFPRHHLDYMENQGAFSFKETDTLKERITIADSEFLQTMKFWRATQLVHDSLAPNNSGELERYLSIMQDDFGVDTSLAERIRNLSTSVQDSNGVSE